VTRRLRDDRDTLAGLLEDLQSFTGLPYTQLEKDLWLTEALRGVVAVADDLGLPVYFKAARHHLPSEVQTGRVDGSGPATDAGLRPTRPKFGSQV